MQWCPSHMDAATTTASLDGHCLNTLAHYAFFVEHHRGDVKKAKQLYERVLAIAPTHSHAVGNYAMLLHEAFPDDVAVWGFVGVRSFHRMDRSSASMLAGSSSRTISRMHTSAFSKPCRARVSDERRHVRPVHDMTRSCSCSVGNYAMYVHAIQQDMEKAEQVYRQALALDPEHADNLGNFAFFLGSVRRHAVDADFLYKRALAADRRHATNWFHVAAPEASARQRCSSSRA
ncbi:hypothetical protein AC1031_015494 [Aphanomyces cochlioides]|nr:hypothetical protein AC1031_015494 [Aphanomyces cochlioides]